MIKVGDKFYRKDGSAGMTIVEIQVHPVYGPEYCYSYWPVGGTMYCTDEEGILDRFNTFIPVKTVIDEALGL
jgi:hypothetical protein